MSEKQAPDDSAPPKRAEPEMVVVGSDWQLFEAAGVHYGKCLVRFSPPYDSMDFQRGFTMGNPTHLRCAMVALILALESVDNLDEPGPAGRTVVVYTKHKRVHELVTDELTRKRAHGSLPWPKSLRSLACLLTKAIDQWGSCAPDARIVYVSREADDDPVVKLTVDEDELDAKKILSDPHGGPNAIGDRLAELKTREAAIRDLLASRARASMRTRLR